MNIEDHLKPAPTSSLLKVSRSMKVSQIGMNGVYLPVAVVIIVLAGATASESISQTMDPSGGEGVEGWMTEFSWDAPAGMEGRFAAIVEFEVQEQTRCSRNLIGTGEFRDDTPVVMWARWAKGSGGRSLSFAQWDRSFQAHVGDFVDTRDFMSVDGAWGFFPQGGGKVEERFTLTIAGFGLEQQQELGADFPLSIDIQCEDPFRVVSMQASREGHSYTDQTLEHGVGAKFATSLTDTMAFANKDRLEARFDESRVRFETAFFAAEDEVGRLELHHPGGVVEWPLPQPEADDAVFDGGPGEYAVELNWRAKGGHFHISGILIGVDPVDSLDDVV